MDDYLNKDLSSLSFLAKSNSTDEIERKGRWKCFDILNSACQKKNLTNFHQFYFLSVSNFWHIRSFPLKGFRQMALTYETNSTLWLWFATVWKKFCHGFILMLWKSGFEDPHPYVRQYLAWGRGLTGRSRLSTRQKKIIDDRERFEATVPSGKS